jgi:hypothetical protein
MNKTMTKELQSLEYANILHHLNYRWRLESLALWQGDKPPFETYRIYEGFESFLSLDTLERIDGLEGNGIKTRLRHALIDHYVQRLLLPHDVERQAWMRGAAAAVDGQKIYLKDIITWCQRSSSYEQRQVLLKETRALCRFLKPFTLNHWNVLMESLHGDLGFSNYVEYCREKKGIDYDRFAVLVQDLLDHVHASYLTLMDAWCRERFGRPLDGLNRYDAIHLLCLSQFDSLYNGHRLEDLAGFFKTWQIDLFHTPGLYLELGQEAGKSAQAICFLLQVPEEVYVLMKPEGGWIDLETLWHELGHGLSAVFTSSDLDIADRDLATGFSLSESFAFLLQNMTLSPVFLTSALGLSPAAAEELHRYKTLRDLALFMRYGAKFLAEHEMFTTGDLKNGEPYARLLTHYTGFQHQIDQHLFDLAPEFYSLDYVLGWVAGAMLERHLEERLGPSWIYHPDTGTVLKHWWEQGYRLDLPAFLEHNGLGPLTPDALLDRWRSVLRIP